MLRHQVQQVDEGKQVVAIVLQRLFHGFAHRLACRKVDNGFDAFIFLEQFVKAFIVQAIELLECGADAGHLFNIVHNVCVRVGQVINNNDFIACALKFHYGVRADVARTACYQDSFFHIIK